MERKRFWPPRAPVASGPRRERPGDSLKRISRKPALVEGDGRLALPVDVKLENIGPRIVSRDIDAPLCRDHGVDRDVGVENAGLSTHRSGNDLASRRDDDRVSVVDPFISVRVERVPRGKVRGQVARAKHRSAADHPAATLARDMLQRPDPVIAAVVGRRDIELDALRIQREARERHVAFPAYERTDAAARRVDDVDARPVAEAPYGALYIGRHELAMLRDDGAVCTD